MAHHKVLLCRATVAVHAVFPGTARDFLSNSGRCGQAGVEFAHSVFITVSLAEENLQLALFFGHIRPVLV